MKQSEEQMTPRTDPLELVCFCHPNFLERVHWAHGRTHSHQSLLTISCRRCCHDPNAFQCSLTIPDATAGSLLTVKHRTGIGDKVPTLTFVSEPMAHQGKHTPVCRSD